MGLWEFLTKPIKLTSHVFYWQEPLGYRLRLRNDFLIRCVVALGVCGATTGIFGVLFALNVNPPGLTATISTGVVIGLIIAGSALLARREHVSGTLWIYEDHILRQRSYASLSLIGSWNEMQEWPNESISRCVIIPNRSLGKSFSVMLLKLGSTVEIVGIPTKIPLKELVRHLTEAGIPVEKGDSLPDHYNRTFDPKIASAIVVFGMLILSGGLGFYLERIPRAGRNIVDRKEIPHLEPESPPLPQPGRDFPNPIVPPPMAGNNEPPTQQPAAKAPAGTANSPVPTIMPNQTGLPPQRFPNRVPDRPGNPRTQPDLPTATAKPNPPNSSTTKSSASAGNESKLVGNAEGGVLFHTVNRQGKTVLGFEYSMGSWAGEPAIRGLTPLHERSPARGRSLSVVAKEGYAVGGLKIDAPKYVSAIQIIFYRLKADGQLDPQDSYTSEWLGKPSGKAAPTVDGAGKKVIGIYGRRGAVLDALGLVFE